MMATLPLCTYTFFTDAQCSSYVATHYPRAAKAYKGLRAGAFRADLFRYVLLYTQGGIWLDIPYGPGHGLQRVEQLIPNGADLVCSIDEPHPRRGLYQGFIAAKRGNPILRTAIEDVIARVAGKKGAAERSNLGMTGPVALRHACERVLGRKVLAGVNAADTSEGRVTVLAYRFTGHPSKGASGIVDAHGAQLIDTRAAEDYERSRLEPHYSTMRVRT